MSEPTLPPTLPEPTLPAPGLREAILRLALRGGIREDEAIDGLRRVATALGQPVAAVEPEIAAMVRAGLLRDPIRIPEGALKCHWHLEPTPAGAKLAASSG